MFRKDLEQNTIAGIPYYNGTLHNNLKITDDFLDGLPKENLKPSSWVDLQIRPKVSFVICYTEDSICLKYYISEPYFKADYKNTYDPVSEDSCVEFFIAFGDDQNYYNLEFNALGTCLAAYGAGRNDRQRIPENLIKSITHALAWRVYLPEENNYQWTFTIDIPLAVFCHSDLKSLEGKPARANVYKCGDKLFEPHYLIWNAIQTDEPDFHQPQFFKKVSFEDLAP
jgi:hypothetical protein